MEGSGQQPSHNGCKEGAVKRMKKDPAAASGKSVVVLKGNNVTIRNGVVFMPNTIEMAQLKKPEKGQFKTNVQFSSMMTELDVSRLLMATFPFLRDQRLYCAAAADNRTRLDFHGQPRIWDGQFLKRKIKGNSALYILIDKGEIEAQIAQNSSSSDTGFCDQEMDISSNAFCETHEPDNSCVPNIAPEDIALFEGFSETAEPDNFSLPSIAPEHMALFEVVQDINPKSGSLEGGYEFYIFLTQPIHASDIRSGIAYFKGVNSVALQKVNPYTFRGTVPSSSRAGDVEVTVLDQTGNRLGMTTFRYVDHEREMLKQLVNNKEKQCLFFSMWAQECALGKFGNYNTAQGGDLVTLQDQGQTKQQQSLQLLQLLVYTAAETDAQEFIKMIFSTSAGPIVFNSYKDKPPLPEDVARANGHTYLAQYLQDVNTRLSKEVGSEAQSNAIDWLELVKSVQTQASAAQIKSVKEEKHPSESDDSSSDYFADSETSSNGSLGLDEANQPDSDSDSSIDKELCNIAGWYNEEPNKRPATCARQEGPSCETPEVEKSPNREDSGAPLLDNKDRTPFEKEKPAADSNEEKDYAVGRGFINSLSQWFSTTRKKRKDETKSATIRRSNGATFFWGPFDKGDTSGQANVHSAENSQESAGKGHLSSQRRTAPDFKYSRIIMAGVVLVVLVVLLVLAGIMQGIGPSRLSPPKKSPPPVLTFPLPSYTISSLLGLPPRALPSSTETQPSPTSRVTPSVASPFSDRVLIFVHGLISVDGLVAFLAPFLFFMVGFLFRACIDTGKKKMDGGRKAIGKSEKERKWPDLSNFIKISLKNPLEHNEWEEKLTTNLEEKLTTNLEEKLSTKLF